MLIARIFDDWEMCKKRKNSGPEHLRKAHMKGKGVSRPELDYTEKVLEIALLWCRTQCHSVLCLFW